MRRLVTGTQLKVSFMTAQSLYTVLEAGSVKEKASSQVFGSGLSHACIKNIPILLWLNQVMGCASRPQLSLILRLSIELIK